MFWRCSSATRPGAALPYSTCCQTFRATGITTYPQNGGTLEHPQQLAAHKLPRTTKLYDLVKLTRPVNSGPSLSNKLIARKSTWPGDADASLLEILNQSRRRSCSI
jgi:hypothetical protein